MVAAADPANDQDPSRNRQCIPESGWDCSASAQWLGAASVECRVAKTGANSAQTGKADVILHKEDDELLILDD
jgi:hypothetical protein